MNVCSIDDARKSVTLASDMSRELFFVTSREVMPSSTAISQAEACEILPSHNRFVITRRCLWLTSNNSVTANTWHANFSEAVAPPLGWSAENARVNVRYWGFKASTDQVLIYLR